MTSSLLFLLNGLVLLVLCLDLTFAFDALPGPGRALLTLLAAATALVQIRCVISRRPDRLRDPLLVVSAAATLLGLIGLAEGTLARRIEAGWEAGARGRLEARAGLLEQDFSWFLREILRPVGEARVVGADAGAAFEALSASRRRSPLPRDRYGLSIYQDDLTLLAWDGNSGPIPRDLLTAAGPEPIYRILGSDTAPRLCAVEILDGDGLRRTGEFLLRSPLGISQTSDRDETTAPFDFLPRWNLVAPAHVQIRGARGGADELAGFFGRQGNRYWGRMGHEGGTTLSFPLRSPRGETLAIVSLVDRRASQEIASLARSLRQAGALIVAAAILLASLLLITRGVTPAGGWRLAIASAALWMTRWSLLLIGGPNDLPRLAIFDARLYASSALGGLLRSPGDLLLTAASCLLQAWLLRAFLSSLPPPEGSRPRRRTARLCIAGVAVALVPTLLLLHRFLDRVVVEARFDLSRVTLDPPLWPRLALQASIFFLVVAAGVVLAALLRLARRLDDRPARWPVPGWLRGSSTDRMPLLLRTAAAVLLLTMLYVPFLHHAYDRMRQDYLEHDLRPRVLRQREVRRTLLERSLAHTRDPEFAAVVGFAEDEDESGLSSFAYRLWNSTPMAKAGLASSLQIYDAGGDLLSRFAVNLAPMLEIPFARAAAAADGGPQEVPPRPQATVKKAVLFGARWVRSARRPPHLVVMTVVEAYDNLPMLAGESIYLQMFGSRPASRTKPDLLRFDPMVAVFGPGWSASTNRAARSPRPPLNGSAP